MSESIETTTSSGDRKPDDMAPAPAAAPRLNQTNAGERPSSASVANYELALHRDPRWALREGSRHFEGKSAVFGALHKIAKRLTELEIPYSVVGGMALFHHGLRRFTDRVEVLVTKQDLKQIHEELSGLGYRPPHRHSKHLRDTESGVRIEFLTTGGFPGDGKQKPVAFPDPAEVSSLSDGISYINLATLIELKLASGMTNSARLRDLADVQDLIKALDLAGDSAQQLNPYVRAKYAELREQSQRGKRDDVLHESEASDDSDDDASDEDKESIGPKDDQ